MIVLVVFGFNDRAIRMEEAIPAERMVRVRSIRILVNNCAVRSGVSSRRTFASRLFGRSDLCVQTTDSGYTE